MTKPTSRTRRYTDGSALTFSEAMKIGVIRFDPSEPPKGRAKTMSDFDRTMSEFRRAVEFCARLISETYTLTMRQEPDPQRPDNPLRWVIVLDLRYRDVDNDLECCVKHVLSPEMLSQAIHVPYAYGEVIVEDMLDKIRKERLKQQRPASVYPRSPD